MAFCGAFFDEMAKNVGIGRIKLNYFSTFLHPKNSGDKWRTSNSHATAIQPAKVKLTLTSMKQMRVGSQLKSGIKNLASKVKTGENSRMTSVLRPMKSNNDLDF